MVDITTSGELGIVPHREKRPRAATSVRGEEAATVLQQLKVNPTPQEESCAGIEGSGEVSAVQVQEALDRGIEVVLG